MAVTERTGDVLGDVAVGSVFRDDVLDARLKVTSVSEAEVVLASESKMYAVSRAWLRDGLDAGTLSVVEL